MDFLVSGVVSHTEIRVFTTPASRFVGRRASSSPRANHGVLHRCKSSPLVSAVVAAMVISVREAISVGLSELSVPCPSSFGYFDEAQRFRFADCGSNRLTINTVFFEIFISNRKPTVLFPTMVR
ncbi:hypothetical protein [Bradyrhizobium sp. AZCC 1578]|uniref:hypothetical protein n=1 Tax=Bradyrhizobium sp. AZCC 1578 TaxID=3117027 RepID=UPI002FF19D1E